MFMAAAISVNLGLFPPGAILSPAVAETPPHHDCDVPPWPRKVCEERPEAATATGGQTYDKCMSDF